MLPILPPESWREFRGVPSSKGLNQTTHLAVIADEHGKLHKCYVKLVPATWPTPLTEALAWLLANALDLPRPDFAAIVLLPINKLKGCIPLDQHWLTYDVVPAFCSSAVEGKSPIQGWRWLTWMRLRKLYKRAEVAKISAFDQWVDNQDRHSGNLLVRKNGECVPIDNEFSFYSLLWGSVGIAVHKNSLLQESSNHLTLENFTRFKVDMANSSKNHALALDNVSPHLRHTIDALVNNSANADALWQQIYTFLNVRAQPGWMSNQLGVTI